MRPIKFRAWDKNENVMFQVGGFANLDYDLENQFNYVTISQESENRPEESTPRTKGIELMQFTGLLDKNGREIYEGDILQVQSGNTFGSADVRFENGSFCMKTVTNYIFWMHYLEDDAVIEIIGNVYENPELLK
jgi:uncharacterized phage protein (TIGR01671 family)